jgi:hypothetical protein
MKVKLIKEICNGQKEPEDLVPLLKRYDYINDNKDNLNENYNQALTEDECFYLTCLSDKSTGIKGIVLWIGDIGHGYGIKVSNIENSYKGRDCFTLTIPNFKIIGRVNKNLITKEVLHKIIKYVKLNMDLIVDYTNGIKSTEDVYAESKHV